MESELAAAAAQFGVAGLIGWMWLTERRTALARERQIAEAHDRLMQDRVALDAVMGVVSSNTRALTAVESGLREIAAIMPWVAGVRAGERPRVEGSGDARAPAG